MSILISATEVPHLRREIPNSNKALYIDNITDDTELGDDFENSRRFCRAQVIPNPRSNHVEAVNLSLVEIKSAEEDDAVISMGVLGHSTMPGKGFAVIGHSTGGGQPWEWGDGTRFAEWEGEAIDGAYTNWEGQLREGFPWRLRGCLPEDPLYNSEGCALRTCVRHIGRRGWVAQKCQHSDSRARAHYVVCQGPLNATNFTPLATDPTEAPRPPAVVDETAVYTTPAPPTGTQLPPLPFIIALPVLFVAVEVVAALLGRYKAKADNAAEDETRRRRRRRDTRRMSTGADEVAALEQESARNQLVLVGTLEGDVRDDADL